MKVIMEAIEKLYDVIDEVEYYASRAIHLKQDHKTLAEGYIKAAEAHVEIFRSMHETVVKLIDEQKSKGNMPTKEMQFLYDQEHQRIVKEFAKARMLIEEFRKAY